MKVSYKYDYENQKFEVICDCQCFKEWWEDLFNEAVWRKEVVGKGRRRSYPRNMGRKKLDN